MVVLLVIAVLSLLGYLTLSHVISRGRQLAVFIRLSDEQQMAAQRVAFFSQRLSLIGSATNMIPAASASCRRPTN